MFAPLAEVALSEMLSVLRPGGRIAFSTWPAELLTGKILALTGRYLAPPVGISPPPLWGDPKIISERFTQKVSGISFEREMLLTPTISPQHLSLFLETTVGPLAKLVQMLKDDQVKLKAFRSELLQLVSEFFVNNTVRQHYIMTKATKI